MASLTLLEHAPPTLILTYYQSGAGPTSTGPSNPGPNQQGSPGNSGQSSGGGGGSGGNMVSSSLLECGDPNAEY